MAELSGDTYQPVPSGAVQTTTTGPVTYTPLASALLGTFRANAYETADGSQLVFAIRGTDFSAPVTAVKNVLGDLSFGIGIVNSNLSSYVQDAANFVQTTLASVRATDPGVNVTLTGHSLGGGIAQLLGEASGLTTDAFNAPGAGQIYNQLTPELAPVIGLGSGGMNTDYRIYGDQVSVVGTPLAGSNIITLGTTGGPRSIFD